MTSTANAAVTQSTMSSSSAHRWIRSSSLDKALPELRRRFAQTKNDNSEFQVFPPEQLQQAWDMYPHTPSDGSHERRQAAVLIPICSVNDTPSILFTVRSSKVTTHKSEISFPGGHLEPRDENDLIRTALREAQEELLSSDVSSSGSSYPWNHVEIIGIGTAIPSIRGTPVTPVIAVLPYEIQDGTADDAGVNGSATFQGHPDEVDTVFYRSIERLVEEEESHVLGRLNSPAPYFPSPYGNIWGLTAFFLRPVLRDLLYPAFYKAKQDARENRRSESSEQQQSNS